MIEVPSIEQIRDDAGRCAVWQRQERRVDGGELGADEQLGPGEMRMVARDRIVVTVATGESDEVDVRVASQQPDQLCADVPGRADDPDPQPTRAAVRVDPAARAGEDPRRAVRRDRGRRSEVRAHRHARPLAGG